MAYVTETDGSSRWLDYNERSGLIEDYVEEQRLLMQVIQGDDVRESDLSRLEYVTDELERLRRIHRGEYDVRYFGVTYFSDNNNPDNPDNIIPIGVGYDDIVDFHRDLNDMFDEIIKGMQRYHVAYAVPRSHGKTAWISNIFLLHELVYRHRKYIVLFSETTDVAGDFITWGRYQLKLNEKLRGDFGELLYVQPSKNESDNKYEFITTSGAKVEGKGLGTQTRGLRHGSTRPDLFILDDLESEDSTNTPELIEKSKSWFREAMLPAMAKDGMCVYLGTILCYGSLLHYVVNERRDFQSRKFSAIEQYADREDLWNEWRDIYRSDDGRAGEKARTFYEDHETEMLSGTKILWPGYWTYYELVTLREENGTKAFNQEYQNEPTDEERQIFKPEYFTYFSDGELEGKRIRYYAAIDPAMGKEKGDYTVIVTMARNEDTGVCYIVDTFMERCHPDVLIQETVKRTMYFQYEAIAVESQMAQEFIADKLSDELRKNGYPSFSRIKKIKQRTRKALRIEALLPDIQNGRIRFNGNNKDSLEQFTMYPMASHDDFPDAVSMCYSAAKGGQAIVRTVKKRMR